MFKGKKGTIVIYFVSFVTLVLIVIFASILAPLGVLVNTEFYAAGEDIMLQANDTLQNINDATVRDRIQGVFDSAFAAQENNIEVNANIFQYSWIFVCVLTVFIAFLFTRSQIEVQQRFGGFI